MNRKALFIVAASLTLLVLAAWVGAQEPVPPLPLDAQVSTGSSFTYQGQLKNGGDVFDGSCDFQFRLYDAVSGGSQVGAIQTSTGIGVQEGFFSTNLDFGGEAFDGSARWLGISVRCPTGSGEYITLNPRQALSATPYALSLKPGALVINNASNPDGDPMPTAITGRATASSGHTIAILGEAYSPDGSAVSGDNYSSNGGTGVWGWSGATTGPAAGVRGSANSPQGAGVWGYNSATAGEGKGVLGDSNSPDGSGVFGYNDDGGD
ncbi:MAG TPA: hypothetical protein PK205_16195, partial [Promineifilum sp.]|nr:hypothetical protein [Promineifilum sp.]